MNLRPFELVLITIFGVIALLALVLLATYNPPAKQQTVTIGGPVTIWGTVPSSAFYDILRPLYESVPAYRQIQYVQKDPRNFDSDLLNALADGVGPDLLFMPHEQLVQYRPRIQPISYQDFPLTDFRALYIDAAEIFAMSDGVYSFPIAVDPLVLYWNRDILANFNFLEPPRTWEQMINEYVPTLIDRDFNRNIIRSPLAFGEFRNVENAFGILSLLTIQGGSQLVVEQDNRYQILLNQSRDGGQPFETAVSSFTRFATPSDALFSWNRAKRLDRDEFLAETLVFYFGKGSEAGLIATRNPNLNFAVAEVPQGAAATVRRTYGTVYGLALLRASQNKSGAFQAMQLFGDGANAKRIADSLGMAPVHRTQISAGSNDIYGRIIYSSALVTRGWLNPRPGETNQIFTQMTEDILTNRARTTAIVNDALNRLRAEY